MKKLSILSLTLVSSIKFEVEDFLKFCALLKKSKYSIFTVFWVPMLIQMKVRMPTCLFSSPTLLHQVVEDLLPLELPGEDLCVIKTIGMSMVELIMAKGSGLASIHGSAAIWDFLR